MIRRLVLHGGKLRHFGLAWFATEVCIGLVLLTQPQITDGLLSGLKGILGQAMLRAIAAQS